MYRGFIKCWRCAEDSRAWSRGALHRGVMLTILLKVAMEGLLLSRRRAEGRAVRLFRCVSGRGMPAQSNDAFVYP